MVVTSRRDRTPIDWTEVRARLKRAEEAMEEAIHPSPDRARAIMEERARVLAQAPPGAAARGQLSLVTFSLGRERYAIETAFLREALRHPHITPVPGVPEFIVGVTNLRGSVLVVADLRSLLNIAPAGDGMPAQVLVLGKERQEFGVVVDQIQGQASLAADELAPSRTSGVAASGLVRGVTRDALIVLDGAAVLDDQRLSVGGEMPSRVSIARG